MTRTKANAATGPRPGRRATYWLSIQRAWVRLPLWIAVLLLLLPTLVLMWSVLLTDLEDNQRQLKRNNEDRIYSITQVSAQALKGLLMAMDQTLLELRDDWVENPEGFSNRVEKRRRHASASLNLDMQVSVIGADGRVRFSSLNPKAVGYDASKDQHFVNPRLNPADRMFVSPPYFLPVAHQQLMPFSRRLPPAADGSFSGVIVYWVPPDFVTRIYKTTRFEANSNFTLIELNKGQVLLRHIKPPGEQPPQGRGTEDEAHHLVPAFPAKDEYLSGLVLASANALPPTGVGRWFSLIDQAERTFGWYKFKTLPYALVAGEPTVHIDNALATQRKRYLVTGSLLSVLLMLAIGGTLAWVRARGKAQSRQARQLKVLETKQAELAQSHEHLRRLGQHLASVRETERQRIAQDLHDELGQRLSVMRLNAAQIARQLNSPSAEADAAALQPAVISLKSQIDDTIAVVRQIAEDLRPSALSVGLGPGIQSLCDEFQGVLGLRGQIDIRLPSDSAISDESATTCYRIVQESLTNVVRHAKATGFDVRLDAHDGWLHLSVNDNGYGFKPGEVPATSFGVLGMQERAGAIGGQVTIHSVPGLGTHVKARLPMQANATQAP